MKRTKRSWIMMRQRCLNKRGDSYPSYGGRGITITSRWSTFEAFVADMGMRPAGRSLDRYPDRNGNYEPGNCRWATPAQQQQNTRWNVLEEHEPAQIRWLVGLGFSRASIARHLGVSRPVVSRVASGKSWI